MSALFFRGGTQSMKNLQEATERICELKGSLVALDALLPAILETVPATAQRMLAHSFEAHSEAARTIMLNTPISDHVLIAFERDVTRLRTALASTGSDALPGRRGHLIDAVLLAAVQIFTHTGTRASAGASGFLFRRDDRLFLVTVRQVLSDPSRGHLPDRMQIRIHTDASDPTRIDDLSLPLYENGRPIWRESAGATGAADIAALEIKAGSLPAGARLTAFNASNLEAGHEEPAIGDCLTIIGFPSTALDSSPRPAIGFGASIASSYSIRFQQGDCFITDARAYPGSCGAPVLRRRQQGSRSASALASWQLLGVHAPGLSPRAGSQAGEHPEGLDRAWHAAALLTLTDA